MTASSSTAANGSLEVTGLASAQAYAAGMGEALSGVATAAEAFAAGLGDHGVEGAAVTAVARAQELTAQASQAWAAATEALGKQTSVAEAYASAPDAGDKDFLTDSAAGSPPARQDRLSHAGGRNDHVSHAEEPVSPAIVPTPGRSSEAIRPPNGRPGVDQGLIHFDSALGRLWNELGDDQHLHVDGHALGNIVTDLGEGITRGHHDTNHALQELRRIRTQLPDATHAAGRVDVAIARLDAPPRPAPELPEAAPQQVKDLMAELNNINLVRRGHDIGSGEESHETDDLATMTRRWLDGEIHRSTFERELWGLARRRHESMEGMVEIKAAVTRAMNGFRQWARRTT